MMKNNTGEIVDAGAEKNIDLCCSRWKENSVKHFISKGHNYIICLFVGLVKSTEVGGIDEATLQQK